jgi:hypothetical protein
VSFARYGRSGPQSFPRSLSPRKRGAGIHSARLVKCAVCDLDSRLRGNDVAFDGEARNPALLRCGLELMAKKESEQDSSLCSE